MRPIVAFIAVLIAWPAQALESTVQSQGLEDISLIIQLDDEDQRLETIETPQGKFQKFTNIDYLPSEREGTPDIPYLHRWFLVESHKTYKVTYKIDGVSIAGNTRLMPIQPDVIDDGRERPFTYSRLAYLRNHWFGDQVITMGAKQKLGALTVLPISIAVAQFNPRLRSLKTFRRIEINLKVIGEDRGKPSEPANRVTDFQLSQAEVLTVNATDAPRPHTAEKSVYLVITSTELLDHAREIADYHASDERRVVYETVTPSTTSTRIRDLIRQHYENSRLEAVLIFGDEKKVALHNWSGNIPGDSYYSFIEGNDYIADISLGRLPVSDATEAELMVQKHHFYRTTQASGYNNKNIMLVAHKENYPGKYTANLESIRKAANPKELSFNAQYGGANATNATVLRQSTDTPHAIINFRGHGSNTSWSGWGRDGASFGFNQVAALRNLNEGLSIFFNIACNNGAIQTASDSLAERMLFHDDGANPNRGAIAVLAATIPSLTDVNHKYNVNLFKAIQDSNNLTLGNINALAANKIVRDNGGTAPKNIKMYILFADPLLRPWF